MLGTMSSWFITIYDTMYTTSSAYDILSEYDGMFDGLFADEAFQAASESLLTVGLAFMLIYFFADLAEKISSYNYSTNQLLRSLVKIIVAVILINNSLVIIQKLISVGTEFALLLKDSSSGNSLADYFSDEDRLSAFKRGLNKISTVKALSYVVRALIPYILTVATNIIISFIGISRLVELLVRALFAPFALSDIFRDGDNSSGIRYLKKILALVLQFVVIVGICLACSLVIKGLDFSTDAGPTDGEAIYLNLTGSLDDSTTLPGTNLDSRRYSFSAASIASFLDVILGGSGHYWLTIGVLFARLGLVLRSQTIADEICKV